ncbi:MAG: P-loop NTPase [Candidatus Tectomicrobia bacterium]|nr:P-loop NTPase [Candidatus Tectomicrobia bacterium]
MTEMAETAETPLAPSAALLGHCQALFGCMPEEAPARLASLDAAEVRKFFKRQAFQYHPEVIRELPEPFRTLRRQQFLKLTEAYLELRRSCAATPLPRKPRQDRRENPGPAPSLPPGKQDLPVEAEIVAAPAAAPRPLEGARGVSAAPRSSGAPPRQPLQAATISEKSDPTLLAIGGAKGGTGKSMVALNLAITLARSGQRVVLVDADLGSANMHILLGMQQPRTTLHDSLAGLDQGDLSGEAARADGVKVAGRLAEALEATPYAGVQLLAGCSEKLGNASMPFHARQRLLEGIRRLPTDLIILDLGGDTSYQVIDFFLAANLGVVVTSTEPASILDAYHFLKVCALRCIQRALRETPPPPRVAPSLRALLLRANGAAAPVTGLLRELAHIDSRYTQTLRRALAQLQVFSVINMSRNANADQVAENLRQVCSRMAGLAIIHLGSIPNDLAVVKSSRELRPVVSASPLCPASLAVQRIAASLPLPAAAGRQSQAVSLTG